MEIENKIKAILANLLNEDVSQIEDNASMEQLNNWDSLKNLHLIIAIEEEFEIELAEEEISRMVNLPTIFQIVTELKSK
jgi:acyl carrier protein